MGVFAVDFSISVNVSGSSLWTVQRSWVENGCLIIGKPSINRFHPVAAVHRALISTIYWLVDKGVQLRGCSASTCRD